MPKEIVKFLVEELEGQKKRNPRYSLRAFAQALDVEHSTLSKIMSDKRHLRSEDADYAGVSMAIPIDKIPEAKRRMKEFRRSLGGWLSEDDLPKTNVYRLNIQLFPLA